MSGFRHFCKYLLFQLFVLCQSWMSAQQAVGTWKDHIAFNKINSVQVADDVVYAASKNGLLVFDRNSQLTTALSRSNGLSDVGIQCFLYDRASRCLVVAYSNANIDLVFGDKIFNVSDIKRSDIPGDKSVYNICFYNNCAYLACGFGIVVIDLDRKEVKDTYYVGTGGSYIPVYDIAIGQKYIYAATAEGLKRAPVSGAFLNLAHVWTTDTAQLIGMHVNNLVLVDDRLFVSGYSDDPQQVSLFVLNDSDVFNLVVKGNILNFDFCVPYLTLVYGDKVVWYDFNFQPVDSVENWTYGPLEPLDAEVASDGATLFVGHVWAGLIMRKPDGEWISLSPNSPVSDDVYALRSFSTAMLVCPGGKRTTYDNAYMDGNVYVYRGNRWSQLDKNGHDFFDVLDVSVNPKDSNEMLAAAWGKGVVRIVNGVVQEVYDDSNTQGVLSAYSAGDFKSVRVGGVAFDNDGNAWIVNSKQQNGLVLRTADGEWKSFYTSSMVGFNEIDKIVVDNVHGYKWFFGRANRIFVHDGESQMAFVNPNKGSKVETSSVNCLAVDDDGEIWVGSNKGIKVIYDSYKIFQNGGDGEESPVTCSNILFSESGQVEYLMAYENVTCIAVDGANRKWVGTASGGLYLISSDGQNELLHFTVSNSPVFSNKIISVAVLPTTGEVFIGTDKGLQVYRGSATHAELYPQDKIKVFPNPVRPGYDGPIAIKGFSRNALVHITNTAGQTLYAATADGGQVVWNGRTQNGDLAASGVYYVFASDSNGQMRSVAKVLIVR